jgi:hypothetical protein
VHDREINAPARDWRLLPHHPTLRCLAYDTGQTILAISTPEIAPELTGHGLPLSKCEAYNRVYEQPCESH